MVNANMSFRVAACGAADHRAPMSAAVNPRRETSVFVARNDYGCVADKGTLEIIGFRNLGFQGDKAPCRPPKDSLLFELVDFWRGIDIEGNPRAVRPRKIDRPVTMQSVYRFMDRFVHIVLLHCLTRNLSAPLPSILVRFEAGSPKPVEAIQFAGRQAAPC